MTSLDEPSLATESARLGFALDVAGVSWWELDCVHDTVRLDDRGSALLAVPPGTSVPRPTFTERVHPDDRPATEEAVVGHLAGVLPELRLEVRLRMAASDYRSFEVLARVRERTASGAPSLITGIFRDITAQVRMARAQIDTHARLRHAEEVARFGHWEFSIDERVMFASDGAVRIYGFPFAGIAVADVQACVLPEHRPTLDRALHELIVRGVPYDQEFRVRRVSDGEVIWVHSRAEYDSETRRVFGVVHDITDRKRAEEEREALIVALRASSDEVRTLSGILPICACCKKIRDDQGYWEAVEAYVIKHTGARFSHGICPDCMEKLYPEGG